jgi:hypothetical protein
MPCETLLRASACGRTECTEDLSGSPTILFMLCLCQRIMNEIQKMVNDFNKLSNVQIDGKKLIDQMKR